MKIQIRQSVFETNSSSMHSLIVMDKDRVAGRPDESTLRLTPAEAQKLYRHAANIDEDEDCYFGRHPFRILSDFISKWKYAYANFQEYDYCRTHIPSKEVNELVEIYHKYFPTAKIELPTSYGVDDYKLEGWLNTLGIGIEEFLINRRYIVICDGDEYCVFDDFMNTGVFDKKHCKVLE